MEKDTATLLREIKDASGWNETRIADELGASQATVNRILNGQPDCKGRTLRAIEVLHHAVCPPTSKLKPRPKPARP
jgi:transcriptional regulator with XRE-family HTH domain